MRELKRAYELPDWSYSTAWQNRTPAPRPRAAQLTHHLHSSLEITKISEEGLAALDHAIKKKPQLSKRQGDYARAADHFNDSTDMGARSGEVPGCFLGFRRGERPRRARLSTRVIGHVKGRQGDRPCGRDGRSGRRTSGRSPETRNF